MKRREFIASVTAGAIGTGLPFAVRGQAVPCPPGTVQAVGGTFASTSCPAGATPPWYSSAAHGRWTTLPNSILAASGAQPSGSLASWSDSDANSIIPWSGGVLNTVGVYIGSTFVSGTFLCIWGGGHTDYGGNEVYAYGPLESGSPTWSCLRPATNPAVQATSSSGPYYDSNGNPVSRHTYGGLAYLPSQNWMLATGGYAVYTISTPANPAADTFQFNIANPAANQPWTKRAAMNSVSNGDRCLLAVYDPTHNGVWAFTGYGNYAAMFYNIATDSWAASAMGAANYDANNGMCALDTKRGIVAVFGGSSPSVWFYRTNNGVNSAAWAPTIAGSGPSGPGGIAYDSVLDSFVLWANSGQMLHTLTAPSTNPYSGGNAWTWGAISPNGGATPTGATGTGSGDGASGVNTGTYGRFQYVPNANVTGYLLLNRPGDPIYFYKP